MKHMICELVIPPRIPERDMHYLDRAFDALFGPDSAEAERARLAEIEEARLAALYAERRTRLAERVARQATYNATYRLGVQ